MTYLQTRPFGVPNQIASYDPTRPLRQQIRECDNRMRIEAGRAKQELAAQQGKKNRIDNQIASIGDSGVQNGLKIGESTPGKKFGTLLDYHEGLASGKYIHSKAFEAAAEKLIPDSNYGLAKVQAMLEERFGNRIPPYFSRALEAVLQNKDEVVSKVITTTTNKVL